MNDKNTNILKKNQKEETKPEILKNEKGNFLVKVKEKTSGFGKKIKEVSSGGLTKKKVIVLGSILLLGAAVYLNFAFFSAQNAAAGSEGDAPTLGQSAYVNGNTAEGDDYFAMVELTRQKARDESMEVLKLVVDNEDAIQSAKDEALLQIQKTANEIQDEANIESLVVSKGFDNCIAVISDGKANIVVKTSGLFPNEVAQIKEIVYEQSGIVPANVTIIERID